MTQPDFKAIIASLGIRRHKLGMSQDEVAGLAGITQTTLSTLERGLVDPRLSSLLGAARAVGMDVRLVPRELVPRVDDLLRAFSRPDATVGQEEQPLYMLREDEEEPGEDEKDQDQGREE